MYCLGYKDYADKFKPQEIKMYVDLVNQDF